ncbi:MAG: EF-Tu/IF-2/RF-3 family GTPase [Methanomicrobiales archaeon]|nr:EF-Tu/IF-2/RF-3 family GTPase [Methanomicrobiales archaeon]MDI6875810.1 EF-Tu/IF-2/RF-3 family GTPase [Methanomicrobiales archaeon]
MGNLNVVVLGQNDYARDLGKKGTSTDITFYNLKKGEDSVTFLEPTRYPERFAPLYLAAATAEKAILVVDGLTPLFGEAVLMLDCLGIRDGFVVLRNFIGQEQVMPLIRGTVVERYRFAEDNRAALREQLLEDAAKKAAVPRETPAGSVSVDHFFTVRGIGTVVLGGVVAGAIRRHDTLSVLPLEKTAQVRSIQKHDDEAEWAGAGDRVGLALKNVGVEDLERGYVLTSDRSLLSVSSATGTAHLVKYWNRPLREGMVLHLGHWMQFVPARLELVQEGGNPRSPVLTLALEKPLVCAPKDRVVLHHLEGGKLRIVGTMTLAGWVAKLPSGQPAQAVR